MKLDLDQLRQMALKFNQDYLEDGDLWENMCKGAQVYTISFEPQKARASVHLQWSYFRNLVANEADHPATYRKYDGWLYLSCTSHGVEISACLDKTDVVNMLKELGAAFRRDADIISLFTIWQNITGWDLDWPVESTDRGETGA